MCLMIILKFTKRQSFTISLEDTFFDVLFDSKMFEWLFGRAIEIKYAPLNEYLKAKTHDHFKIIILKWLCILQKNYDLVFFHFNMKN